MQGALEGTSCFLQVFLGHCGGIKDILQLLLVLTEKVLKTIMVWKFFLMYVALPGRMCVGLPGPLHSSHRGVCAVGSGGQEGRSTGPPPRETS